MSDCLRLLEKSNSKALAVTSEPVLMPVEGQLWWANVANKMPHANSLSDKDVAAIKAKLPSWFESELKRFKKYKTAHPSADSKWVKDIIKSGTHSDKVAALSLLISESPIHNLDALDSLTAMAVRKEQRTAVLALEALKDLLVTNLLPDRHLVPLNKQDWSKSTSFDAALLNWFEAQLVDRVDKIIDAIEAAVKSNVDFFKKRALELAVEILSSKPEKESRLLRIVVNKLGDPSRGVCNKAIELLKNLLKLHPTMKSVVAREVRQLIYWAGQSMRIVYVCCVFLSQIPLKHGDHVVSADLVECFMGLFEKSIAQGEVGSSLLSVLLNGINKAFPYLEDTKPLTHKIDSLFKIVHTASFSASTQALLLISFIAVGGDSKSNESKSEGNELTNRYFRALYSKLVDDHVATKSRNTVFFNLLFRSLKRDTSAVRCAAFIKRLMMICLHSKPTVATAIMLLIAEVCKANKDVVGILTAPSERKLVPNGGDQNKASKQNSDEEGDGDVNVFDGFDLSKREPLYAASETPALWETSLLCNHFHPSVKAFADQLKSKSHSIVYNGDPTTDFSISAFLDRFAYKNPKKKGSDKDKDQEEPLNADTAFSAAAGISDVAPEKQFFYKYFDDREKLLEEGRARNRSRHQKSSGNDLTEEGSDFGDEAIDRDEAEIDAFADQLAEDLMNSAADNYDDPDIDDEGDEEEDADDDFDGDDNEEGGMFQTAGEDDEDVEDDDDGHGFDEAGADDDDDDGEFDFDAPGGEEDDEESETDAVDFEDYLKSKKKPSASVKKAKEPSFQLAVYNEDEDEDLKQPANESKKSKLKKKKAADSDFADAADYEEEMEAIVNQYASKPSSALSVAPAKSQKRGIYNISVEDLKPSNSYSNQKAKKSKK